MVAARERKVTLAVRSSMCDDKDAERRSPCEAPREGDVAGRFFARCQDRCWIWTCNITGQQQRAHFRLPRHNSKGTDRHHCQIQKGWRVNKKKVAVLSRWPPSPLGGVRVWAVGSSASGVRLRNADQGRGRTSAGTRGTYGSQQHINTSDISMLIASDTQRTPVIYQRTSNSVSHRYTLTHTPHTGPRRAPSGLGGRALPTASRHLLAPHTHLVRPASGPHPPLADRAGHLRGACGR